uniref:Uncharacterized protein n=1 Tax=Meloidogyne incognita TaxID=6306 RepID=A0A914LHZ8_MELIC
MELNHHGMSPDRSTTDCATIQPDDELLCSFCKCVHNKTKAIIRKIRIVEVL